MVSRASPAARKKAKSPKRPAGMSMLTLYINRAGKTLSPERKRILTQAKSELRKVFHRPAGKKRPARNH